MECRTLGILYFEEKTGGEVKKMEILALCVIFNKTQFLLPLYL